MEDPFAAVRERLYAYILDADFRSASALLRSETELNGSGVVLADLIHPTLARVGERFVCDKLSLAQVYLAGKIVEDFLAYLGGRANPQAAGTGGRIAVIGNIEDDYHALGRNLVGAFLKMAGWLVEDLGNDVLAARFVDAAEAAGASVIGVSAMMRANALNIAAVRAEIEKRGLSDRVKLAVGGAVFVSEPGLVAEIGGDGTCANAMEAPALFEHLLASIPR